eukprot:TRINITY_DN51532_c0_g1_i2.p1 TRINITY_DN51532_c0_g1~~TRINITY_DN51532_c0_g1_i2.p1  ORF type:complete len:218 (-),score=11.36 TRINITY_DN51532_c0_g1_i2:84-737(-)
MSSPGQARKRQVKVASVARLAEEAPSKKERHVRREAHILDVAQHSGACSLLFRDAPLRRSFTARAHLPRSRGNGRGSRRLPHVLSLRTAAVVILHAAYAAWNTRHFSLSFMSDFSKQAAGVAANKLRLVCRILWRKLVRAWPYIHLRSVGRQASSVHAAEQLRFILLKPALLALQEYDVARFSIKLYAPLKHIVAQSQSRLPSASPQAGYQSCAVAG